MAELYLNNMFYREGDNVFNLFNEVKNNDEYPYYWLGALAISVEAVFRLEKKLNQLSFEDLPLGG